MDALLLIVIKEKLMKLKTKDRAIIALRVAGYTQEQCGKILGVTRAATGYMYKRALQKLKREVIECTQDTPV